MRALHVPDEIVQELRAYPPEIKRKIRQSLDDLRRSPSGKPLRDDLAGLYSLRVGRYRIIYRLAPGALEIVTVGDRKTVYLEAVRILFRRRPS